jgi:hypothetical protein
MNRSLQPGESAPRRNSVVVVILGDHLKEVLSKLSGHPSGYSVDLSWIMTLVFSIWYLQYKINECATFSEQWTAMAETPPPA